MRPFFLFLVYLVIGCENQPKESRFEKIARAYCECTGKLASMNEQAATLARDTNAVEAFREKLRQIQTEYDSAKSCSATIVLQFGKLKTAELDSVRVILADNCANLAEQSDLLQEMLGE
ncbi:MAG: hypothetical protein OHK0019_36440 [Saprospiraceae bacterium]